DAGSNKVSFKFTNSAASASNVSEVYFDDVGLLSGIASITNSPVGAGALTAVKFVSGATPPKLPSGENLSPDFDTNFAVSAKSPSPKNGLNEAGDWLVVAFNLIGGKTFSDVLAKLSSGDFRIGLHVQGIGVGNKSDSFVTTPPSAVPLPAAAYLFGT